MLPGKIILFGVLIAFKQCTSNLLGTCHRDIYPKNHSDLITIPTKHGVFTVAKAGCLLAANTKNI